MRGLGYDKLVLLCDGDSEDSSALRRIKSLEDMANHALEVEPVRGSGFMEIVEEISSILAGYREALGGTGRERIALNISGGPKLLGDAALFAAFRLGVEAYHCDTKVTKLPVLKGATARDMFTPTQLRVLGLLDRGWKDLESLVGGTKAQSRQSTLRVLRELRKLDLVKTQASEGSIRIALTDAGVEAKRASSLSAAQR
jgi:hypothetical protein